MRKSRLCCRPAAILLLGLLLSIRAYALAGEDFTIVALPDSQFYSESFPQIAAAQIDWLVTNRAKMNIVYVAHLGDITNKGDEAPEQWRNASDAMYRLENPTATGLPDGIPYGMTPGNHDHQGGGTHQFNAYFGVAHFARRPFYGGHFGADNNSHFDKFSASGLEFVVVYIDFNHPRFGYSAIDAWTDCASGAKKRLDTGLLPLVKDWRRVTGEEDAAELSEV